MAVLGPRLAYSLEPTRRIAVLCGVTWGLLALIGLLIIVPFLIFSGGSENVEAVAECSEAGVCVVGVEEYGGLLVERTGGRLELRAGSGPFTRSVVIDDSWFGEKFEFVTDTEVRVGTDCQWTIQIDPEAFSATSTGGDRC